MAARSKHLDPSAIPLRRRKKGNLWAILARFTQLLLLLAIVAAIFLCFLPVMQQLQDHFAKRKALTQQISETRNRHQHLQREIHFLKHSPQYIERQARDRLNLGRQGETIFRFDSYNASQKLAKPTRQ